MAMLPEPVLCNGHAMGMHRVGGNRLAVVSCQGGIVKHCSGEFGSAFEPLMLYHTVTLKFVVIKTNRGR